MDGYPQQENRSTFFIVLLLLLVCVIIAGVILYLYYSDGSKKQQVEVSTHAINMRAQSSHNIIINTSYALSHGNAILQEGIIYPNRIEQFNDARNDTNYTIIMKAIGHYPIEIICDFSTDCVGVLPKIGEFTTETLELSDKIAYIVSVHNGTFQDVLLCIKWDMSVFDVKLNKKDLVNIPSSLEPFCDKTYGLGNLAEGYYVLELEYELENKVSDNGFELRLIDKGGDEGFADDFKKFVSI
jgi:hypothetical protein